ncbi:MAG: hypothetical protein ACRDVW_03405 [Acidimicrobiales bacterium]
MDAEHDQNRHDQDGDDEQREQSNDAQAHKAEPGRDLGDQAELLRLTRRLGRQRIEQRQ